MLQFHLFFFILFCVSSSDSLHGWSRLSEARLEQGPVRHTQEFQETLNRLYQVQQRWTTTLPSGLLWVLFDNDHRINTQNGRHWFSCYKGLLQAQKVTFIDLKFIKSSVLHLCADTALQFQRNEQLCRGTVLETIFLGKFSGTKIMTNVVDIFWRYFLDYSHF